VSSHAYIGTSGWNYQHWKPCFYNNIPAKQWLSFCASQFNSIEVNSTFYRLQSEKTFQRWYQDTPENFRFAIKANRYLTHTKRLRNAADSILLEKQHASSLNDKLAVVLWQLPANFSINLNRLNDFIVALKSWDTVRHTIEFRDPSWFDDSVSDLLCQNNIAVCQSDAGNWPLWQCFTADFVYVRLHGKPQTYASNYSVTKLENWANQMKLWLKQNRDVFIYFDNDTEAKAPFNALSLQKLLQS
jgi:uncharacterized protein YecE (DUF72 family)